MKPLSSEKRVMKALCQAIIFKEVYFTRKVGYEEIQESIKATNGYVPGWVLSERTVGGSEGLRRLRGLREKGYKISRHEVKDSTDDYRLQHPYSEVFEIYSSLIESGEYPAKFNAQSTIGTVGDDYPQKEENRNTGEILIQQKLF
jgi:hypothetical protein